MKKIIKASVLLLSLSTAFTMNAEPVNTMVLPDAARDKLKAIGLSIEHVEPSPVKDIFTVISREGVSYVSKDGDYIFTGSLFHVKGKDVVNTTEQAILMGVREFASKTKSIDYKSPNEKYRLAIFTDITCGYCQKLHHDLKSYLDAGISIKFLAFPRAGLNSVVAGNMAKIWCSAKPNEALDAAMNPVSTIPEGRPDEACLDIIKSHFQVASTIPLQGTPTMVTLSGKPQLFTGWLSPENLVTQMGAAQK
ncbi:thioredoxin fold domain-containing protein [Salmonella enterica]|uniref:thioredoxin fold domain-containing protein n=1 Tax=Enterobacter hormaechei TaxID=158836 RepID=UPI0018310185|nr:thioredoxin fold domain-containing protein [Escherichia coli]EGS3791575.1 thioredoxin fold domain-containing protein [Salmonella enterica]ELI9003959.1 thioredoxin fold domain-containing protein [Enterobacter roggenkampii]MBU5622336.1 thioredoxin fold domain-containing protein [Enterobacteriaceae bacterium S5_ASV_15]HBY0140804.1 thiol:disulfide interchange protein [Klebsiella pneumoniae]